MMTQTEKRQLFNEATAFYELAEHGRLNIPEKKEIETYIPYIVNMAFGAELYLKLLLIHTGKSVGDVAKLGHRLSDLYKALRPEQQDTIYQSFKRPLIYSIPDELESISAAFVEWRYLVLDKADGRRTKKLQFHPYFIKEFNEVLARMCQAIL